MISNKVGDDEEKTVFSTYLIAEKRDVLLRRTGEFKGDFEE